MLDVNQFFKHVYIYICIYYFT